MNYKKNVSNEMTRRCGKVRLLFEVSPRGATLAGPGSPGSEWVQEGVPCCPGMGEEWRPPPSVQTNAAQRVTSRQGRDRLPER